MPYLGRLDKLLRFDQRQIGFPVKFKNFKLENRFGGTVVRHEMLLSFACSSSIPGHNFAHVSTCIKTI